MSLSPEGNQHINHLMKKLNEFRSNGKYSDIELKIPQWYGSDQVVQYKAHKLILASQSGYFKSQFTSELFPSSGDASKVGSVEIQAVSNEGFAPLLEFIYTSNLLYDCNKAVQLLQVSDYLGMELVMREYEKYVAKYDFPLNQAINFLEIAHETSWRSLEDKFLQQILRNFTECLKLYRNDLLEIQPDFLATLMNSESIQGVESDLLDLALSYMSKNTQLEAAKIEKVLGAIKYPMLQQDSYKEIKAKHAEAAKNVTVATFLAKLDQYFANPVRDGLDSFLVRPREGSYSYLLYTAKGDDNCIYVMDVHKKKMELLSESQDPTLKELNGKFSELEKMTRRFMSLELENGNLSCVVNWPPNDSRLPCFMRYENQVWHVQYRTQIALDSFLHRGYRVLNFCGYDPNRTKSLKGAAVYGEGPWHLLKSSNTNRSELALAYDRGLVYTIGGQNEESESVLNSCEGYQLDPRGESWSMLAPMLHARQGHKVAVLMSKIYVVGGFSAKRTDKPAPAQSLVLQNEVYDIGANKWEEFPSLGAGYHYVALTACGSLLYALVSTEAGWKKKAYEVHSYDPLEKKWQRETSFGLPEAVKFTYASKFTKFDVSEI